MWRYWKALSNKPPPPELRALLEQVSYRHDLIQVGGSEADEGGIQIGDRYPSRWQREAEGHYSYQTQQQPTPRTT